MTPAEVRAQEIEAQMQARARWRTDADIVRDILAILAENVRRYPPERQRAAPMVADPPVAPVLQRRRAA